MPRRNLLVIFTIAVVSTACYLRADHNRYGRYLGQALDTIDRWALEPVPQQQLFDAAMQGMVGKLDEYSAYISAEDATGFEEELDQQFGGIGVEIKREGEPPQLTVVTPPLPGTPAQRNGIRVHDQIVAIDGVATSGMTMRAVIRRMRGQTGTAVRLEIRRAGADRPLTMEVVRETIRVPSVLGDRRNAEGTWTYRLASGPRIGYVRIVTFGDKTVGELESVLSELQMQPVDGLVIDLRDNAGGLLSSAVGVCDLFLPEGKTIVSIRRRRGILDSVETSTGRGICLDLPLAVLVNRYSASASEIVAACLQDQQRARIVGERSWGKGTVQNLIPVESGKGILKLTVASYWRPSGKNIHRLKGAEEGAWGVAPDEGLEVPMSDDAEQQRREARARRDVLVSPDDWMGSDEAIDPVLKRAVHAIRQRIDSTH
ncbi:MAG: S41 family peptidase [Pirellulales bacterium]